MLSFKKITSPNDPAQFLCNALATPLRAGKDVLWLVPGGSSISIAVQTSLLLQDQDIDTSRLTVSLTDERFGPIGHADSNWKQLFDQGFTLPHATLHPVLINKTLEETVTSFAAFLDTQLSKDVYALGFFGIGADGHTAGMLPHSLASRDTNLASGYMAEQYTRITVTSSTIGKLSEAVVYAVGEAKYKVLKELSQDVSIEQEPAQALKQIAQVTIFSDYSAD